jgi:glycosyltransferase involved in cell wall biosynthesis
MKTIVINGSFLAKKVIGLERYAIGMSQQLKALCPGIVIVAPQNVKDKNLALELEPVETGCLSGHLWEQIDLPRYLKKTGNPLLINLTNTGPLFYHNQVTVIHDVSFMAHPEWFTKQFCLFYDRYFRRIAKMSTKVFTDSEFSRNEIIKYLNLSQDKIKVIHPAVPRNIIELAQADYLNPYGEYILTVSSIESRKNIGTLISAFNRLKRKDLKLIVAGMSNKRVFSGTGLEGEIPDNGNIIFKGYVNDADLTALYKNARLFVYLSLYEGFGFPPLEAMACGCPVLVSDRASLPEVC